MVRSWYGSATFTTISGLNARNSSHKSATLSASTCGGLHPVPADGRSNGITLRFCSAGQHHVRKNRIGSDFLRHDGTYASCADNQSFTHKIYLVLRVYDNQYSVQKYRFILAKQKFSIHLHHQNGSNSGLATDDSVAQLVEHNTFNVGVLGSSPSGITKRWTEMDSKCTTPTIP